MTLRPIWAIAAYALSLSCNFSMHASGSGLFGSHGGSSPPPASAPPEDPAAAPQTSITDPTPQTQPARVADATPTPPSKAGPSKRGSAAPPSGAAAPVMTGSPVFGLPEPARGPAAGAMFNGTYIPEAAFECSGATAFDPKGADVQSIHASGWGYQPGFRCPSSCENPAKVTFANGKASVPLVWIEDHPPEDGDGVKVTMHRYKLDIPLNQFADKSGYAGGATVTSPAFHWSHNNIYEVLSDSFAVRIAVADIKDVHWGTGRAAALSVLLRTAGATEKDAYTDEAEAACKINLVRTDWKPGDGLSDDDGGDSDSGDSGDSSSSHSSSSSDSSARRSCKSSCRQAAGSCRTACHGSSAKCASNCNHDESSCERSCG